MSLKRSLLKTSVRGVAALFANPALPLSVQRAVLARSGVAMRRPRGTRTRDLALGGRPARRIDTPASDQANHLLYLHGGAYVLGGLSSHTGLAAQMAGRAGARAWLLDYRLAPEHPHPAALEDALAAYEALLVLGALPGRIAIAGDSAGGGLALALALAIREHQLPMPSALALISPWTDLTLSGRSVESLAEREPMLSAAMLEQSASAYCENILRTDPAVSPLFGDFTGLPPMIVHAGSEEILLDDSRQLEARAASARVPFELRVYEGLWHVFQAYAGLLPEADESLLEMGAFLQRHRR